MPEQSEGELPLKAQRDETKFMATAAILAGGQSRRMGRDKSLLDVGGLPLIQRVANQLAPRFDELLVSAAIPGMYDFLGLPVFVDSVDDQGPLFAVVELLEGAKHDRLLVVPCDVPDVPMAFVEEMLTLATPGIDVVVPLNHEGIYEPLLAVYRRSFLNVARPMVDKGERTLPLVYPHVRLVTPQLPKRIRLHNLNTPEEYDAYLKNQ